LLLRCAFDRSRVPRAAAAATTSSATRGLLDLAHGALCLLLRLLGSRGSLLLRILRARSAAALRLLLLRALAIATPLLAVTLPLRALRVRTLALGSRCSVVLAARLAGALFVLADFFLHEPPRLLIQLRADLVVAAVRATLPSFGIGLFATGAEDGLGERHR
jgi:hypothetical protein